MKALTINRFEELDYACAEALNTLAVNVAFAGTGVKKILITSSHANEGKSFISMNLARVLAQMGKRVVLVDADLRRSVSVSRFGIEFPGETVGLAHCLAGLKSLESVAYKTNVESMYMVPVGRDVVNPLPLLNARMQNVLERLSDAFDVVLVDTPPVGIVVDAVQMARWCDGALLVVGYNDVTRRELSDARHQIEHVGCPILGAVLSNVSFDSLSSKKYYNRTYYSHYNSAYYKHSKAGSKKVGKAPAPKG